MRVVCILVDFDVVGQPNDFGVDWRRAMRVLHELARATRLTVGLVDPREEVALEPVLQLENEKIV